VRRYHAQNTYREDYVHFVRLLYRRLLERGWEREYIRDLILNACAVVEKKSKPPTAEPTTPPTNQTTSEAKLLFIHLQYHPDDISRRRIQELYDKYCGNLFQQEMDIERPVIAYSRPPNIGDYVTQARLHQAPGKTASTIMGEYRQGLNP
jgi:hypothetical protein